MTDITDFEDIRPYNDAEVRTVLNRLVEDPELHNVIVQMKFPRLNKWFGGILRFIVKLALRHTTVGINTVNQLQEMISKQLEGLLSGVSSGVTVSGLENLDASKPYLFISNHRDIAMDPAMVDIALHRCGRETVRIAIGDNLLSKSFTSDLMRINKSFIVRRSVAGRRNKLAALLQLSGYIRHSLINENSSIWIAQREGRAKDGKDKTDTALIKMLTLSKQKTQSFSDALEDLSLVPVAISYELDPCDNGKARELHALRSEGVYHKQEHEDLLSIYQGLVGDKGHIHVAFGTPITGLEGADSVAAEVDRQIFDNYRLHPTNIIAYQQLHDANRLVDQWRESINGKNWQVIEDRFNDRMAEIDPDYRDLAIASYANPVCSRLEAVSQ